MGKGGFSLLVKENPAFSHRSHSLSQLGPGVPPASLTRQYPDMDFMPDVAFDGLF